MTQESNIHDSIPRLVCQECGFSSTVENALYICPKCNGTFDIEYDLPSLSGNITPKILSKRRNTMWRYRELLPVLRETNICSLGEGGTPLVEATSLKEKLGVKSLHVKNDGLNPTGSFKARQVSVGISKAREFGVKNIGVVSSGNVGFASSAYSARAGFNCNIIIWAQMAGLSDPRVKMRPAMFFGAKVMQTKPARSPYFIRDSLLLMRDACIAHAEDWMPLISARCVNPFAEEGAKTMAYEICEGLNWDVPDWVCVPIGGGGLLSMLWKGFKEMKALGLIKGLPRIAGFQSGSFQQVAHAFKYGMKEVGAAYEELKGVATAYSLDGDWALQAIRESKGFAEVVPVETVRDAQKMLAAREGIIAEPMAAWGTAGLIASVSKEKIHRDESVVVCVTGKNIEYSSSLVDDEDITEISLDKIADLFKK